MSFRFMPLRYNCIARAISVLTGQYCCARTHTCTWIIRTMATVGSTAGPSANPLIGVCQLTCTADKQTNVLTAKSLIQRAKDRGAEMVFLPEACDYMADSKQQSMDMAEYLQGETVTQYRELANASGVWLSLGGVHEKVADSQRIYNTHVIIDNSGEIRGTYSKTHLFDLDLPGTVRLCESDYVLPGPTIKPPVATPAGNVGMAICYDLRFPEMSSALTQLGAEILTYPSAFTVPTGMAHWKVLLRNRAIECQCYVVAAAQTGRHNDKRFSYGHTMVVDPWGTVVAECQEGVGLCMAEIDLGYLQRIRSQMPVVKHKRHDMYGHISLHSKASCDSQPHYKFGKYKIGCSQVFYRTALSYAFVNIKPVLPGHVLVASIRNVPRFADLDPAEVSDLSITTQTVSNVVQKHFGGTSVTISTQDGPDAGQTVQHVHTHILPRKPGDFSANDDIYVALEKHDNDIEGDREMGVLRTEEQMNTEAASLRTYFT